MGCCCDKIVAIIAKREFTISQKMAVAIQENQDLMLAAALQQQLQSLSDIRREINELHRDRSMVSSLPTRGADETEQP